jgi:hypothetical protein
VPPGKKPFFRILVFNYHNGYLSINYKVATSCCHRGIPPPPIVLLLLLLLVLLLLLLMLVQVPPGKKPFFRIPVFNYHNGYLSINYSDNYFLLSQRHAEVPRLTQHQYDAMKVCFVCLWF